MALQDVGRQDSRQASELCNEHHPDRHGRSVAPPEAFDLLDRVPECVPVVENLARPGLFQVHGDDARLYPHRALHELREDRRLSRRDRVPQECDVVLDERKDLRVGGEPAPHNLS